VKCTKDFGGLNVDWILFLKAVLLVAGNEGEGMDVLVKLRERELHGRNVNAVEKRQAALVFRFQIAMPRECRLFNRFLAESFTAESWDPMRRV
jgi:hypothetical protein